MAWSSRTSKVKQIDLPLSASLLKKWRLTVPQTASSLRLEIKPKWATGSIGTTMSPWLAATTSSTAKSGSSSRGSTLSATQLCPKCTRPWLSFASSNLMASRISSVVCRCWIVQILTQFSSHVRTTRQSEASLHNSTIKSWKQGMTGTSKALLAWALMSTRMAITSFLQVVQASWYFWTLWPWWSFKTVLVLASSLGQISNLHSTLLRQLKKRQSVSSCLRSLNKFVHIRRLTTCSLWRWG